MKKKYNYTNILILNLILKSINFFLKIHVNIFKLGVVWSYLTVCGHQPVTL